MLMTNSGMLAFLYDSGVLGLNIMLVGLHFRFLVQAAFGHVCTRHGKVSIKSSVLLGWAFSFGLDTVRYRYWLGRFVPRCLHRGLGL